MFEEAGSRQSNTPDFAPEGQSPTKVDVTEVTVGGVRVSRSGNEWPTVRGSSDGGGVIISGPDHHGFI